MTLPYFLENPNPEILLSDNYLVLDFETTSKDKGSAIVPDNKIVLAVWGKNYIYKCKFADHYHLEELLNDISKVDFIVAHNAKFELQWLLRAGVNLRDILVYDTMLGEYVLAGNRKVDLSLDGTASRYVNSRKLKLISTLMDAGIDPVDMPRSFLKKYCVRDVKLTEQIFSIQREKLKEKGLLGVQFTKSIFTPALADIEMHGMQLDCDRVDEYYEKYATELAEVEEELHIITGGINMNSPQQVAKLLYQDLGFKELKDKMGRPIRGKPSKAFPEGQPKTDSDTILKLKATNKKQKRFIELKLKQAKLNTAVTRYLKLFKKACNENYGKLYGKFNQAVTATHRLSSSSPNFQNFDRNFKPLFKPRIKEYMIGERDYRQLEFRVAVYYGQDEVGFKEIEENFDVHSFTASVLSMGRTPAKAYTFKPLYGGSGGTPREKKYFEAFRNKYKGITEAQKRWLFTALQNQKLAVDTGMTFYYPDTRMLESGYVTNTTKIFNYPIQYLATAEIVLIGVTYFWHYLRNKATFIVNTVHDSIITEEYPEETEELNELAQQALVHDVINYMFKVYNIDFNVPLEIETKLSSHWSE